MGFDWRPLRKGGLRGAYFHEICKCASALCADLVDHISRISSNVRGIYGWKFIYAGKRGHGFHCADFHGTQNFSINVCGYSSRPTEFYRNRTKNVENTSNFFLSRWVKNMFHFTGIDETHKCSTALCGYILHGISPASAKKCEKYG